MLFGEVTPCLSGVIGSEKMMKTSMTIAMTMAIAISINPQIWKK